MEANAFMSAVNGIQIGIEHTQTRSRGWGALAVLIALFSAAALAWDGLASLPIAWSQDEYSHGYLIPPIALYLFLRRLDTTANLQSDGGAWLGVPVALLSIAVIFLGNLTQIPDLATYGFIGFLFALTLSCLGFKRGLWFIVPLAYLLFMLPLPNFIYLRMSIGLQLMSSQIGVWVIQFFGVPVYLEGNVIDLGVYKLQVAEACSGLRYLFPLASFGFLFAALYNGPNWHKLIIFLSIVPITVLMNSFRIGVIGLLVDRYGIEQAEGFLHVFEGWVIFAACIAVIFLIVVVLQRFTANPLPLADTMDIASVPVGKLASGFVQLPANVPLLVSATAIFLAAVAWLAMPEKQFERVARETFSEFPLQIEQWAGATSDLTQDVETVLGADDYFLAEFQSLEMPASVNVFMAYYHNQGGGKGIHSPEVCLPVGGWEVSQWKNQTVHASNGSADIQFQVNRAIIQRGLSRQLVYYWIQQRDRKMTSAYASKMYTMIDSIMLGRTDAGIVRLVTQIGENEPDSAADERLQTFLRALLPTLIAYIPE